MSLIRVRFVITGGCHSLYSGRQFHQVVSLVDGAGHCTLVSAVLNEVRSKWPEEFSQMSEQVQTCTIKMLKTGDLLSPSSPFSQYLSKSDLATALDDASQFPPDSEKSPIIIHLVFQQHAASNPPEGDTKAPGAENSADTNVRRDRTDDRPQNSGGCCLVM